MAQKTKVQYINFYTAGSAAYQYDVPIPQKAQVKLPKPRRKKRIVLRVDPVAVLGMCLAVGMLVMMLCGVVRLWNVRQQQTQMAAYVQRLEQENARLQETYEQGYDPEEIRRIATAMGMIPVEQAQHITVQVEPPQAEEDVSAWQRLCAFLTGLFA